MARKTKYNLKWEEEFKWVKKHDDSTAKCILCNQLFRIDGSGKSQVSSHSKSKKHLELVDLKNGVSNQATLVVNSQNEPISLRKGRIILTTEEKVLQAEAIWALKCAVSNYSFASVVDSKAIFQKMFPDSVIAQSYSMCKTKVKYIIQFGISPYLKDLLKNDLRGMPFTFKFDETTTSQVKKQYDGYVQYWSKEKNCIVSGAYCGSLFLGHCTADQLKDHFFTFGRELEWDAKLLLHLGMDGPNVNLKFQRIVENELRETESTTILKLGTCCLHPIHNAFKKALAELDLNFDEFVNDLHFFFKHSSARRHDFCAMENVTEVVVAYVLRHVSSRWLSLKKAIIRILEQWVNLKEFFLKFLPKEKNFRREISSTLRYKRICHVLTSEVAPVYFAFVTYVATEFESVLVKFQSEDPLIHLLYPHLSTFLFNLMTKILRAPVLQQVDGVTQKEGRDLVFVDCSILDNQKKLEAIDIGTRARTLILDLPVSAEKKKVLRMEMKQFFVVAITHLQKTLPLNSSVLRDVQCLHPLKRSESSHAISRLALTIGKSLDGRLTTVFGTKREESVEDLCDMIRKQWATYQMEELPETLYLKDTSTTSSHDQSESTFKRIDNFWAEVGRMKDLNGSDKFPQLFALAKCCLTLSHGNATPERGFSINNALLEKNRLSLDEGTIVALRMVKDSVKSEEGVVHFPITRTLIDFVKGAHQKYFLYQQELRKMKEQEKHVQAATKKLNEERNMNTKRKAEVDEEWEKVQREIETKKATLQIADDLVTEGNRKLKESVSRRPLDKEKITSAQVMIEMGIEKQLEVRKSLEELQKITKAVLFKKSRPT